MNKHLNNWLDRVEGLKENYSNNNIAKEIARQRGETHIKPTFNKVISIDFDGTICKKQKYGDGTVARSDKRVQRHGAAADAAAALGGA